MPGKREPGEKLPKILEIRLRYSASLACLSIIREEGLISSDEEYFYLQRKIKDKYRKEGLEI